MAGLVTGLSPLGAQTQADSTRPQPAKQGADSALSVNLLGRLEFKAERTKNDRCLANQQFSVTLRCRVGLTPELDFQFSLLSGGSVSDRVRVNVDYDSQREFDGSNNISISYLGKPGEFLQGVQLGNVTFAPPATRFITAGIPSGNYGVQAIGQVGSWRVSAIAAQQKGNVVRDQVFTVGARTTQAVHNELEDYQIEPRRFFFVVDPQALGARFPNIDILDSRQMSELARALPDSVRPARVFLYRLLIGGQPPNPDGPRFALLGDPTSRAGQVYELLREGVDYYLDPSLLWVALVRPLSLANERLVAAYTLRVGGRDTTIARFGGTPDLEFTPGHAQFAHLLWDPALQPTDAAFRREIRSVYRLAGSEVRRESVRLRIVTGRGGDQEKAPGVSTTYLELFGLSQRTNPAAFDARNRLWPRPNDPNDLIGPVASAGPLIRDVFLVFPSLEPFARRGLASPPTVASDDTLYRTPGDYLYSAQHPQSSYRLQIDYESESVPGTGLIALSSVQLRPGSERITVEGRQLTRGLDYDIDYDLGRITLLTVDTLRTRPQRVVVRYEENPLFTTVPTSMLGLSSEWRLPFGNVALTALSQSQRTTFTRPPLGFEPQRSLMAGGSATFAWALGGLSRGLARLLPSVNSLASSRLDVRAEIAVSQPSRAGSQAYVESFEVDGGITLNLLDSQWQYSSQPALGTRLASRFGAATLDTARAAAMAFQSFGTDAAARPVTFTIQQIDPQTTLAAGAIAGFEQMLWLTLYPLAVGGKFDPATGRYRWQVASPPTGRRWRSVRTALGVNGSGVDLTRGEALELWTLVDTTAARRGRNPVLVFDFGDVSENSVAFAPDTLRVSGVDSLFSGKKIQGYDVLNSERDPFSRAFSADVNDTGLPGDVADRLTVMNNGAASLLQNFRLCALGSGQLLRLGDVRADCTVRNSRLDEEDIDQDNVLNLTSSQRDQERLRRFVVDLGDPRAINRVGVCGATVNDVNQSHAGESLCWVQVRIPFNAPDDSTGGGPLLRRVRALRITMLSGSAAPDNQFTQVPIARLRIVGGSLVKRAPRPLRGIGGEAQTPGGYVIASSIGTQDSDSTRGLIYQPPPGVADEPERQGTFLGLSGASINERSMRLQVGGLPLHGRAETYLRYAEGQRSVMTYREMRLWARGRGNGWGTGGDLQFFVKLGRDANNFYAFRTPLSAGPDRAAWEPEIRVAFSRFFALRARLEAALTGGRTDSLGCTALDSALIAASALPPAAPARRLVACDDGYMVYSADPVVTPPNLGAVQELAVGIVRVDSLHGASPPLPGDTLEVWVDDVRLADVKREAGYVGMVGVTLTAGDAGSIRLSATRQDPNFRQLGEQPTFYLGNDFEVAATWRLDKFFSRRLGIAAPLTITHTASSTDPQFLPGSDVRGEAIAALRRPRGTATNVSLGVRLATPISGTWLAPILNNLGLTAYWSGSGRNTEYAKGRTRDANIGVDYLFQAGTDSVARPAASGFGALSPASVRVSSNLASGDTRVDAFALPADVRSDSGRRTRATQRLLHNNSSVEFRPAPGLTARWDALTVRDLREYKDKSLLAAAAASRERDRFVGVDLGVERERNLLADLLYVPLTETWVRPRLQLSSSYAMLRDPNAPVLIDSLTGSADPRLARRFGNTQRATAAATVDLSKALSGSSPGSLVRRVAAVFGPLDLSVSRDQLTSYDAAPFGPSARYQFGLGAIDAFRSVADVLAASAGAGTQLAESGTLTLPGGVTVSQRMQRTDTRHWSRRLQDRESVIDGVQLVLPDVSLRWSGQPSWLGSVFSSIAATARATGTRQAFVSVPDAPGMPSEVRAIRIRTYPVTASATTAAGKVSFSAGFSRSERLDSLPGSAGQSRSSEVSADLAKEFALPAAWKVDRGLRARLSYQRAETQSYVSNVAAVGARSRLTDNGRHAFTLNAGTDLAENVSFSLQGSRVVTFDRNFNRRFTQTVISAVLNIQPFNGVLR